MFNKKLLTAVLITAFLGVVTPLRAWAADTADEVDLHSNTVQEGLVVGIADISSGKTMQIGPIGGIYEGGHSVVGGGTSATAYSGACVVSGVSFTPTGADSIDQGSISEQALTGNYILTGAQMQPDTAGDYIEFYDGTTQGDYTTCKLDLQGGTADDTELYNGPPIEFNTGVYVYSSSGQPWSFAYQNQDYLELYDGTERGTFATCKLDLKGAASEGTIVYAGAPIHFATSVYAYNSDPNSTWQIQYRIEDQGE